MMLLNMVRQVLLACRFVLLVLFVPASFLLGGENTLTVAGISVTPDPWDKQANLGRIEKYARLAAQRGAQLVITPEGFLEGYVANENKNQDLTRKKYEAIVEPIEGPSLRRLRALARELSIYLAVGFAESRQGYSTTRSPCSRRKGRPHSIFRRRTPRTMNRSIPTEPPSRWLKRPSAAGEP